MKVKCLRPDNVREYDKLEFKTFCVAERIRLMRTVPSKAKQNGVAERMNRTLNKRTRSLKIYFGLSKTFWVDASSLFYQPVNLLLVT